MRITIVRRGGIPPGEFCPWMICIPPETKR